MSPTETALLWAYAAVVAVWPVRLAVVWYVGRTLHRLSPTSPRYTGPDPPLVTAIIPAKDEEASLPDCLASVCGQTYPNLEIVVVNDRSGDATPDVARRFAEADPRVRLLTVHELPPGWTGKTHALQVAADGADGAWFWFLDADTRHAPENLSIVMEYARRENAAMASLLPELRCETFWENVVQPLAGIVLMQSFPPSWVNDDRKKRAFANGQYILIRRDAYFASGGHRAVRDRFVEDIGMAERVKALGLPIRVAVSHGIGSTRMYASLGQMVRGWSRILYDALGRNPWRLAGRVLDPLVFSQSGHVALVAALVLLATGRGGPFAWTVLAMSVLHHACSYAVLSRLYRLSVPGTRYVACFPLANLVMDVVLVRSLVMCLTGKVVWRGTAYGPETAADAVAAPARSSV